jgi:dTDP-4-amino-4,6-dideoxygalactose transaminase
MRPIPLAAPDIDEEDVRLVGEVLASGWLASGSFVPRFEAAFAARLGARCAVAVSSGTAALHLALLTAGITDGDLVVTSPFSFVASANAILYERGRPVFVDVDPVTLTMDPDRTLEAMDALHRRRPGWPRLLPRRAREPGELRALLPVHIFGRPVERMAELVGAARARGLAVVEDACEAIGAVQDGVNAGRWGDAAAFGFYPNKQLTTGEGGMLVGDDEGRARLWRSLRNQGRGVDPDWLRHERLGFNYRMDELSGALGVSQLGRLDALLARRAAVAERYNAALAGVDGVTPLAPPRPGVTLSWFLYPIRLAPEIDRDAVMRALAERGVCSRPYFWPIHLQPFYRERFGFMPGDFPHAEAAGCSMLALPMGPNLAADDIDRICTALAEVVAAAWDASARRTA